MRALVLVAVAVAVVACGGITKITCSPPPLFNIGNGRVAGAAIGTASSVGFYINDTALNQTIGAVWMSRGWLDNQPDPSEAAFDNTIPAFDGSATLTVAGLDVCTTTRTEMVCAN